MRRRKFQELQSPFWFGLVWFEAHLLVPQLLAKKKLVHRLHLKISDSIDNLHWPEPLRHQDVIMDQTFTSYIYEGKVACSISVPLLPKENSVDFTVEVAYAVCNEICTPQKQTLRYQGRLQ